MTERTETRRQIGLPAQAWSIKDLLYGQKQNFFLRDQNAGNPERARWPHLTRSGSQSEHRICLILPTGGFSFVISFVINLPSVPS